MISRACLLVASTVDDGLSEGTMPLIDHPPSCTSQAERSGFQRTAVQHSTRKFRQFCRDQGIPIAGELSSQTNNPGEEEEVTMAGFRQAFINFVNNHADLWLYYVGNSNRNGDWCLNGPSGQPEYLSFHELATLFHTHAPQRPTGSKLTIVSDACYTGAWVQALFDFEKSNPDFNGTGKFIELHCASTADSRTWFHSQHGASFTHWFVAAYDKGYPLPAVPLLYPENHSETEGVLSCKPTDSRGNQHWRNTTTTPPWELHVA
eukprot:TRINITY_DN45980_c0_g1_i1.p1 TRINITY_DN45980_c0_g1~~TRINITY_DN45980_c0_g1_i1.p1  ORF type:complete len:262 (+),score=21.22 TRINITY_DN45980_c0_g1_i1:89-874(+)